jgi:hypothetical protein
VVYAFLSPAPMAALWDKVRREMRAGSLFISNSLPCRESQQPRSSKSMIARQTRLYCYQL